MSKKFLYVNSLADYEESIGAFEEADFISSSAGVGDAGKPIVLDAAGLLDSSLVNVGGIDHGGLAGLGDDDHTIYTLADGTRVFTGDQSMGGFKLLSVGSGAASIVNATDAANKAYVDAIAFGTPRVKGNVVAASTANVTVSSAPATLDGVTLATDDRVLLKDQTDPTENGIYDFNGTGSPLTRSEDFDNSPVGEIYNGVWIPKVLGGTVNTDGAFIVTSVGTGLESLHTIGTDDIVFGEYQLPTTLSGGDGVDITAEVISVDLLDSGSGLEFAGGATDELAIDFATTFTIDGADDLAFKISDLASTTNSEGASIVGIEDTAGSFTSTDVEGALAELVILANEGSGVDYTVGTGGVTIGDIVYVSADNTVRVLDITTGEDGVGVAMTTVAAAGTVTVISTNEVVTGVMTGMTAGDKVFWDGSSLTASAPTTSGSKVWIAGIAKNATDLIIGIRLVKKNS